MTDDGTGGGNGKVTRLPTARPAPEPEPPARLRGLHGFATTAMALCALVAIGLALVLITVNWTSEGRHVIIVMLVLTIVALIASALTVVFAAARATYPRRGDTSADD